MKRVTVLIEDAERYMSVVTTEQLCGSFGSGEHKEISVAYRLSTGLDHFVVRNHRVPVLVTKSLAEAVEKYNSL